jgi:uncharacterized cupredoxin-like copper-binding protein
VTAAPASASAGSVTFNVTNDGAVAHNLTVIKSDLAPAALPTAAAKVDESKAPSVGHTADLASKKTGTLTVTLQAGAYVLVCQVPGHYGAGMHSAFTVQ